MAEIEMGHSSMFYGASPQLHEFATQLRNNETHCEKLLWEQLRKKQVVGFKFRRQHPILYFVADFYCHKAKLVVEVDGEVHRLPSQFEYDVHRDYELIDLGLTVLRFTNEHVLTDIDNVTSTIQTFIINAHRATSPL